MFKADKRFVLPICILKAYEHCGGCYCPTGQLKLFCILVEPFYVILFLECMRRLSLIIFNLVSWFLSNLKRGTNYLIRLKYLGVEMFESFLNSADIPRIINTFDLVGRKKVRYYWVQSNVPQVWRYIWPVTLKKYMWLAYVCSAICITWLYLKCSLK